LSSGPAPAARAVPVPDLHVDVGKVNIESQTDSCNGVLLEPTFVLTSATCVHPNHTADPFENITFTMGKETKPVKKV
jgi:V8-like Glu-specific endopeptidase